MKEFKGLIFAYQGEQYRNPDNAGAEKDKCCTCVKGQEAKGIAHLAECFQAQAFRLEFTPTSQWMNQVSRPLFLLLFTGHVTRSMMALRLYGNCNNWGILQKSAVERKKDEKHLIKQAKILDIPVADGIYYCLEKNMKAEQATEENRKLFKTRIIQSGDLVKVLVKLIFQQPMKIPQIRSSGCTLIEVLTITLLSSDQNQYNRLSHLQ